MNKIIAIAHKETKVSVKSPVSYILMCLAIIVFNVFFFVIIDQNREATLRGHVYADGIYVCVYYPAADDEDRRAGE